MHRRLAGGCLAAFMLFAALSLLVYLDDDGVLSGPVDAAIFSLIHPGQDRLAEPSWFREAVRDVSSLGSMSVLIGGAALGAILLALRGRYLASLHIVVATLGAMALGMGLKIQFDRPRPDLLLQGTRVFTQSFPSAHSTMAAAVLLTVAGLVSRLARQRRERTFIMASAACIVILIGVSRIYLGVHWPTDVLAGWSLGIAWATACWLAFSRRE